MAHRPHTPPKLDLTTIGASGHPHHRYQPLPILSQDPRLHHQTNQRRENHPRNPPLPQTVHRPTTLPTPRKPTPNHLTKPNKIPTPKLDLEIIEASSPAGLARYLAKLGVEVIEVNRPNRQLRRRLGKTDATDAQAAATAALNGQATARPKTADGPIEAIRMLRLVRRSAVKARTQAINQLHGLVVTAPDQVKHQLRELSTRARVKACAAFRPGTTRTTTAYAKKTLRLLALRYQALTTEIEQLNTEIHRLCARANPALLGAPGVGVNTAATLLVTAGDNPERMKSEASFAALCGASPVQASSGRTIRHRLNRGGNREANSALWHIAVTRMRYDQATIAYVQRRQKEGKTRREIIRCLKRHIARQIYHLLTNPPPTPDNTDLRIQRRQARITLIHAAQQLPPTPPSSHNSNEASTTTTTSLPAINTGSPTSIHPPQAPTKTSICKKLGASRTPSLPKSQHFGEASTSIVPMLMTSFSMHPDNSRIARVLEMLDTHHDAHAVARRFADITKHPVPSDTKAWSQILVTLLTGIAGLDRKKGPDLVDGSDVKAANLWGAIDTPRFNGCIPAGRTSATSKKSLNLSALDDMPYLFFVLWDRTPKGGPQRCRVWAVRPEHDKLFREMANLWYQKRLSGEIQSNNFQLHPPRNSDSNVLRNTCGNLSYPLLFAAEVKDGHYSVTFDKPEVLIIGACTSELSYRQDSFDSV